MDPNQEKLPRMWVSLTKSGIRLDLLSVIHMIAQLNSDGEHEEATEYLRTVFVLLLKTCQGDEAWIEENYEQSMVDIFRRELDVEDPVSLLRGDDDAN